MATRARFLFKSRLTVVTAVLRRRRFDEPVVKLPAFRGRQTDRFVSGRKLHAFSVHFGLVAHDHHEMGAFLGRSEYAPGRGRALPIALSQPPFGRGFLAVAVDVGQNHGDATGINFNTKTNKNNDYATRTDAATFVIIINIIDDRLLARANDDGRERRRRRRLYVDGFFEFEIRCRLDNGRVGARARASQAIR